MNPPDNLDALAHRLAAWTPTPVSSGRDRMLFEAGVATGRRQVRGRLAAAAVALIIGSGGWIWHERTERHRLELTLIQRTSAQIPTFAATPSLVKLPIVNPLTAGPFSYVALRQRFLTNGPDLPNPVAFVPHADRSPAHDGPMLTPFSSRRATDLAEL